MSSFVQIFYDPAAVFGKVRERGSWLAPLLATSLIVMLFSLYVSRTIGVENITRRFFDEHPSLSDRMPADQKEKAIQQSGSPGRLAMGSIFGGVGVALVSFITAVLLMALLAIMDRKPQLPQMLGTVAWSSFPFAVVACLMGVLILFFSKDPSELDPQSLLATNVASFLDRNTTGKFAYSLAGSFDILAIGKVLLLSFGLSQVSGISFGRSFGLVFGLWILWVLLRGGAAAAFGF